MKKIITITAIFVLAITLLTACRAGKEDMTTTGDRNTLPQTTGATITYGHHTACGDHPPQHCSDRPRYG